MRFINSAPVSASRIGFGVNLGSLTGGGEPTDFADPNTGAFQNGNIGQMSVLMNSMGMTWARVSAFWAPDTAALATPLVDRLGGIASILHGQGKKVIVDNAVPGMYVPKTTLMGTGPMATMTDQQLEDSAYGWLRPPVSYFSGIVDWWGLMNEANLQLCFAYNIDPLFGRGTTAAEFLNPQPGSLTANNGQVVLNNKAETDPTYFPPAYSNTGVYNGGTDIDHAKIGLLAHKLIVLNRGIARAVHEFGGKVVLNTTNINVGWIAANIQMGVQIDAVGRHIYETASYSLRRQYGGPAAAAVPSLGIVQGQTAFDMAALYGSFGLPIIDEELNGNQRYATSPTAPSGDPTLLAGDASMINLLNEVESDPRCIAAIVYRLTCQPTHPNASERAFGVYQDLFTPKTSAKAVRGYVNPALPRINL